MTKVSDKSKFDAGTVFADVEKVVAVVYAEGYAHCDVTFHLHHGSRMYAIVKLPARFMGASDMTRVLDRLVSAGGDPYVHTDGCIHVYKKTP